MNEAAPVAPADAWIGVVLPRRSVGLAADRSGYLSAVLVDVGDAVDDGQVVARLEAGELVQELRMAEAALRMAEAERGAAGAAARQARQRHERRAAHPELLSAEELSSAALDAASTEAAEQVAEARLSERRAAVEQLRRRLDLSEIRAPFAGRISRRFLAAGASVAPGTAVVRLATTGVPLIRFAVPPEETRGLAPGSRVRVTGDDGTPLGHARVSRLSPEIDPISRRVIAEAGPEEEMADAGETLWAGLAVRVRPDEDRGNGR